MGLNCSKSKSGWTQRTNRASGADNLGVLGSIRVKGPSSMTDVNSSLLLAYRSLLPSVVSKMPSVWHEEFGNFTYPQGEEPVWVPPNPFP